MKVRSATLLLFVACTSMWTSPPVHAQEECPRAAVVTLPGVLWEDIARYEPGNILRMVDEGSVATIAMRTNTSRVLHGSGFTTIGAGTRADAPRSSGGVDPEQAGEEAPSVSPAGGPGFLSEVKASSFEEVSELAERADYRSEPGALGAVLRAEHPAVAIGNGDPGINPPSPLGYGRWILLASMDREGRTPYAAVGEDLLTREPAAAYGVRTDSVSITSAIDAAMEVPCSTLFLDQGDLLRVDRLGRERGARDPGLFASALAATDQVVGHLAARLDPERDLVILVSPHSPRADRQANLGVAIARGGRYRAGGSLSSASTRRPGLVTLPDVAPTILDHLGFDRPHSMRGRPWLSVAPSGGANDRIERAVRLNDASVFTNRTKAGISTGFVVFQIAIYLTAILLMWRRERQGRRGVGPLHRWLTYGGLAIVAFPLSTYLASPLPGHRLGIPLFVGLLVLIDILIVATVALLRRDPLERLLAVSALTVGVIVLDLMLDTGLQMNATFGNEPIVAGRFTGLGNLAFSILGTNALMTGALLIHRWPRSRSVLVAVGLLFALTIVVDGAPAWGSDVGGVIALVPALGITLLLLTGRRPNLKVWLLATVATLVALGGFLAIDMARPPEVRTHLGRLFEDIESRGADAFLETIQRKVRTNLRVFRSTIWTYLVPPAVAIIAWLLLRPTGRWERMAAEYPKLRAGLIGGLILAVVGYAFNDSGIVIPAMVLSFLAPMSMLIHLKLESERAERSAPA